MSYELKEEVSFNIDKELWLGNLRFDFYDSKETLCNKFFPSDLIYELDRQEVISLKKIQEEVNLIQFNMIKNYNNLVSLCGGQGYSFEKVLIYRLRKHHGHPYLLNKYPNQAVHYLRF